MCVREAVVNFLFKVIQKRFKCFFFFEEKKEFYAFQSHLLYPCFLLFLSLFHLLSLMKMNIYKDCFYLNIAQEEAIIAMTHDHHSSRQRKRD